MALAIESIPVGSLGGQEPPKRRGRPPKLDADGNRVHAPKGASGAPRRARKPSTRRAAPRGPRSLAPEIAGMLTLVNTLVIMSPLGTRPMEAMTDPNVQPERVGDELDDAEIGALAAALDAQARRSPRFRKMLEGMLTAGAGGQLIGVLGIIAARRAARHGIAPPMLDPMLGGMLAGGNLEAAMSYAAPTPVPEPETDETVPERDSDNGNLPPLDRDGSGIDFATIG